MSATEADDHRAVITRISNRGRPIPAAEIPALFDPFRTAKRDVREGLGLGLFIVKQIVAAHGATVEITSEPNATTQRLAGLALRPTKCPTAVSESVHRERTAARRVMRSGFTNTVGWKPGSNPAGHSVQALPSSVPGALAAAEKHPLTLDYKPTPTSTET